MDRHVVCKSDGVSVGFAVALLAEGVGRNGLVSNFTTGAGTSPSSRRAWVEIARVIGSITISWGVALLAEGVGRNSPTACIHIFRFRVALLAEGVGRNYVSFIQIVKAVNVALLAEGVGRNRSATVLWI